MAYVGIDTQGTRALGQALQEAASRTDTTRRDVSAALNLADLASDAPAQLGLVQDGLAALGASVAEKAELAERYLTDPQGTSASLAAPVDALGTAISGLLGFGGPTDLRTVLIGLPVPGADPELDAALARLDPALLPAFLAGQSPELAELTDQQLADLRVLALRLGIEHAGPPEQPEVAVPEPGELSFLGFRRASRRDARTGTEVFWNDFWAGGRSVDEVLADPELLLGWVAGTFELDRRLALATELPGLGDIVASVDFATDVTGSKDPEEFAALIAGVEAEFAAVTGWLPAFLVGTEQTGPDPTQLAQTLAFAARVGWPDPGAGAASDQQRFESAIGFLRANRAVQSALLPTGFEGIDAPIAFFNQPGIGLTLDLGRRAGVIDDTYLAGLAELVDQQLAASGVDLSGPEPVELTEQLQQQLAILVGSQIPGSLVESPTFGAQFTAALAHLRQAGSGPEQRQRIIDLIAAFRTIGVTGPPALTERQLVGVVGDRVLRVLGRSGLRSRDGSKLQKRPEFFLLVRDWGVPAKHKEEIGKYKLRWTFNELGELATLTRKKKSWLSRAWDTVKSIGKALVDSWEDNPLKAIFEVGKIALGVAALVVPGLQALGTVALAVDLAETAYHAIEGDWLSAIGAGLSAFTAGADVFSQGLSTVVDGWQASVVGDLLSGDTLSLLTEAKRVFDIGSSVFQATQADSILGAVTAGLGAAATTLGNGGQLLGDAELVQLGTTVRDLRRLVGPAAGLAAGLEGGDPLAALGNGLSVIAAGAGALGNPKGAFGAGSAVAGDLFGFDQATRAALVSLAAGTGVAASLTQAINAAGQGDGFLASSFLAQAVRVLNAPGTVVGNRAVAAQQIALVGRQLAAVLNSRDPGAAAQQVAPAVLQGLTGALDALNTRPRTQTRVAAQPRPPEPATGARALGTVVLPGIVLAPGTAGPAAPAPDPTGLPPELLAPFPFDLFPTAVQPPATGQPGRVEFDGVVDSFGATTLSAIDSEARRVAAEVRVEADRLWSAVRRDRSAWWSPFDTHGADLVGHYLTGGGSPYIRVNDPYWTPYLQANELLRQDLDVQALAMAQDALFAYQTSGLPVMMLQSRFHGEIENGFFTGHELMHGSHGGLGDVEVGGPFTVTRLPDGNFEVTASLLATWNDRMDFNFTYLGDNVLDWVSWGIDLVPGIDPRTYDFHVTWPAPDVRLVLDPYGGLLEWSGYPTEPAPAGGIELELPDVDLPELNPGESAVVADGLVMYQPTDSDAWLEPDFYQLGPDIPAFTRPTPDLPAPDPAAWDWDWTQDFDHIEIDQSDTIVTTEVWDDPALWEEDARWYEFW